MQPFPWFWPEDLNANKNTWFDRVSLNCLDSDDSCHYFSQTSYLSLIVLSKSKLLLKSRIVKAPASCSQTLIKNELPKEIGPISRLIGYESHWLLRPYLHFFSGLNWIPVLRAEGGLEVLRIMKPLSFCRAESFLGDSIVVLFKLIKNKCEY